MLGFGDPVADAISLLRPRTVIGPSLRAAGEWALGFDTFLHVRIGGLVRGQWVAPLTESVLPGESSYAATLHPDREGAYVSAIRAETFADHWQTEAGTVTFTTVDLADKHFAGSFQVELESEKGGERHHLTGSFAN